MIGKAIARCFPCGSFTVPLTVRRWQRKWRNTETRPMTSGDQTGLEINLGPEMAQSFIEQIQAQWPEYVKTVQQQKLDE